MKFDCRYSKGADGVVCELVGLGRTVEFVVELDPSSWMDLGGGYAKDATRVVKDGTVLEGVDAASFVILNDTFVRDDSTVYFRGEPAPEPDDGPWDAASFKAFGERYVADRSGVYCIRYGYDCYEAIPVVGANAEDFEELGLTFGRAARAGVVFNNGVADETLDAETFALRGRWFGVDRRAVYHLACGGKHTDETTLRPIAADPTTFAVLGDHYVSDATTVHYYLNDGGDANLAESWLLPNVSPQGFEILSAVAAGYARAGNTVFNHGEIESTIADAAGFEGLGHGFARDRVHVYRLRPKLREVEGTTRYSIEVLVPVVIRDVRPDEFVVVSENRARVGERELVFDDDV